MLVLGFECLRAAKRLLSSAASCTASPPSSPVRSHRSLPCFLVVGGVLQLVSEVTVLGLADGGVYEDAKCAGAAGLPMVTRGMVRCRQSATALYLLVIILLRAERGVSASTTVVAMETLFVPAVTNLHQT